MPVVNLKPLPSSLPSFLQPTPPPTPQQQETSHSEVSAVLTEVFGSKGENSVQDRPAHPSREQLQYVLILFFNLLAIKRSLIHSY